jgi:hypothetical protein
MKENEMGGACNTYGDDENFLVFKPEGRNQSGDLSMDGKCIINKEYMRTWTKMSE